MIQNFINYIKEQDAKFIFLVLMLIVLPSLEAPKNLFAVLFVISWVFISKREKSWGGEWMLIDTILLLWIVADVVVGVNAIIAHELPANGSKDIIKFILVGWAVSRSSFDTRQMIFLIVTAVIFSIIPLVESYTNGKYYIELNSVGHVNHTAIYLLTAYILSISLIIFNFSNMSNAQRFVLTISTIILAYVVVDTNSRATSGVLVVFSLMLLLYAIYYYKNNILTMAIIMLISLTALLVANNPPQVVNKFINGTNLTGDSPREKIRNHSYYTFRISPVLGVGFGNYVHFGHDSIKDIVISDKGEYDSSKFLPSAHPHNVFYTYLISGGLIMFSVFVLFWLKILQIIYSVHKNSNEKFLVFSGIGVVMTVLGIGYVNTTLAHEHALLAMFVLGLIVSKYREFGQNLK